MFHLIKVFKAYSNFNVTARYVVFTKRFFSLDQSPESEAEKACSFRPKIGLVLGTYKNEDERSEAIRFTHTGEAFNAELHNALRYNMTMAAAANMKMGEFRLFYGLHPKYTSIAVVGLGSFCQGFNPMEDRDEEKESIRIASAIGCQQLQVMGMEEIFVESFGHAESAAEGAALGIYKYQGFKDKKQRLITPRLNLFMDCDYEGWRIGLHKAAAQNLARELMDTPANLLTPTIFAQVCVEVLCRSGVNVEVKVRKWLKKEGMGAILGAAQGSCEDPVFLELSYYGSENDERPVCLVGSGLTFDSGGVCLKTTEQMQLMRGAMQGAACVVATMRAIAHMRIPLNVRGVIPLCENMPGCAAIRPGDVVTAMNGRQIRVESSEYQQRLLLADALQYSQNYWPKYTIDIGFISRDTTESMGNSGASAFTNSEHLWERAYNAGTHTGDRFWRFPLWHYYRDQVKRSESTDMRSLGDGRRGDACKVAAFLREFTCGEWMHIDTRGILHSNGIDNPYLREGMTGRPTRTLVEMLAGLKSTELEPDVKMEATGFRNMSQKLV